MADLISPVLTDEILSFIILGAMAGFYAFLRSLKKCTDKNSVDLCTLKKAFAVYVQLDLIETKKAHPQSKTQEVKDLVDTLLKDNSEKE